MKITITTDGGFTGRGIGSASADVDDDALRGIDPDSWRDHYSAYGADLVTYALTIGERSVSWVEGAEIPRDLRELFERVWRRR